jgi:plasmid maintenance system killer protein
MIRVIRAFFKALMMTLRGEALQPPDRRYPNLSAWVERGQQLSKDTLQTADRHDLPSAARDAIQLRINRRDISAQTILAAVQHNMHTEYPMLLDTRLEHNLTTLYAMNMNDQYRVTQLAASDELPAPVKDKVVQLRDHLNNIPSSQNP